MSLVDKVKNLGRAIVLYTALSGAEAIAEEMPYAKPVEPIRREISNEDMAYGALFTGISAGLVTFYFFYETELKHMKKNRQEAQ